jgi:crotonobetainyl-CoA:carnitine CoA-transferase CaiB-like acyl-CoA transferase
MADEKGELAGRLMADLGADVVRVEPPTGSVSRRLPPFVPPSAPGGEASLYFAFRNAGKRGITLDVESASGSELLWRLLERADIWIESFRPGRLAELGFAPDDVLARRPELVIASISDFGQTGPYRDFLGTDMTGFAFGGLMHRAGAPHRPPVVAPGALAYDTTGVTACFAALMAYWRRLRTGRGQHLDVSVAESTAQISDWSLPGYSQSKLVGARAGAGIYPLYRCADGWVRLIIIGPHHWRALIAWMGQPEALADPELEQFIVRLMRREEIAPVVGAFFADRKKVEIAREAQARGIPCTPLLEPGEVIANEHSEARGSFRMTEVLPGVTGALAAPLPGEHNREVYGDELGLGEEALATLRAERVI